MKLSLIKLNLTKLIVFSLKNETASQSMDHDSTYEVTSLSKESFRITTPKEMEYESFQDSPHASNEQM